MVRVGLGLGLAPVSVSAAPRVCGPTSSGLRPSRVMPATALLPAVPARAGAGAAVPSRGHGSPQASGLELQRACRPCLAQLGCVLES